MGFGVFQTPPDETRAAVGGAARTISSLGGHGFEPLIGLSWLSHLRSLW